MTQGKKRWTPRDLLRIVFRRRYLFLVGTALFAFVTFFAAHYLPLEYTGTTKFERELDESAVGGESSEKEFVKQRRTLRLELAGYAAVAKAAEELKLVKGERQVDDPSKLTNQGELDKQELVNKLKSNVSVQWDVRSHTIDYISVSVTHENSEVAEQMPNELVKAYIDQRSQKTLDVLEKRKEFLARQATAAKAKITALKEEKIRFQTDHAGAMYDNPNNIQERTLLNDIRLEGLRMQEISLAQTRSELEDIVTKYQEGQSGSDPTSRPTKKVEVPNEDKKNLISQVERYGEILEEELLIKKEKHPSIKHIRTRIATLKAKIAKMPDMVIKEVVTDLKHIVPPPDRREDLERTKRELARVKKEIHRVDAEQKDLAKALANFTKDHQEYEKITDALKEKEEGLKQWADKLRNTTQNLQAELGQRRMRLATWQAAQKQTRPSSPSLWQIMALAIAGGLGCGGGLVPLANLMDRSIATTEDAVKYFNIPVHGVIGEVVSHKKQGTRRIVRWAVMPIMGLIIIVALVLSGTSIWLHLKDPDEYKEWKEDRPGWVLKTVYDKTIGAFE